MQSESGRHKNLRSSFNQMGSSNQSDSEQQESFSQPNKSMAKWEKERNDKSLSTEMHLMGIRQAHRKGPDNASESGDAETRAMENSQTHTQMHHKGSPTSSEGGVLLLSWKAEMAIRAEKRKPQALHEKETAQRNKLKAEKNGEYLVGHKQNLHKYLQHREEFALAIAGYLLENFSVNLKALQDRIEAFIVKFDDYLHGFKRLIPKSIGVRLENALIRAKNLEKQMKVSWQISDLESANEAKHGETEATDQTKHHDRLELQMTRFCILIESSLNMIVYLLRDGGKPLASSEVRSALYLCQFVDSALKDGRLFQELKSLPQKLPVHRGNSTDHSKSEVVVKDVRPQLENMIEHLKKLMRELGRP